MSKHLAEQLARTTVVAALSPTRRDVLLAVAQSARLQASARNSATPSNAEQDPVAIVTTLGLASELKKDVRTVSSALSSLIAAGYLRGVDSNRVAVITTADWGATLDKPQHVSRPAKPSNAEQRRDEGAPSMSPIGLLKLSGRTRAHVSRAARARESREPNQGLTAVTAAWNATCTPLPALRTKALRNAPEVLECAQLALDDVDGDVAHLGRAFQRAAADPYYRARGFSFQTVCRHLDRWLDPPASNGTGPQMDLDALNAAYGAHLLRVCSSADMRSQLTTAHAYALHRLAEHVSVDPREWRADLRPAVERAMRDVDGAP